MFVCLGNICRSPAAQAVMQKLVQNQGVSDRFQIDSSGTAGYHIGALPDGRMIAAGAKRAIPMTSHAKKLIAAHLSQRDLIIAMDRENLANIQRLSDGKTANIQLLSDFLDQSWPRDVPDPYYGELDGFEYVLDMLEAACPAILKSSLESPPKCN
jgi:protein-tyrosine phosphatase